MRGKIIHYNSNDGRGLVATEERQVAFEITQWRSDTAPALNQIVDLVLDNEALASLAKVPDEVLLKEKAGQLAGKLGAAGGAALQSLKEHAPAECTGGWLMLLGKPLLGIHAFFAVSALVLPYLKVNPMFGGGRSFTLVGVSHLSESMGTSVGGAFWTWLAIASLALPVVWKARWAWLALLLPLLATLKPLLDLMSAASQAADGARGALGDQFANQIVKQMADMLGTGIGFWLCLASALTLAGIGIKRTLLPPIR